MYDEESYGKHAVFDGEHFDSRTEAAWAAYFHVAGINYVREPETFKFGNLLYTPDFLLPDSGIYFEVKNGNAGVEAAYKAARLARGIGQLVIIADGMPFYMNMYLFGPRSDQPLTADYQPLKVMPDLNVNFKTLGLRGPNGQPLTPGAAKMAADIKAAEGLWEESTEVQLQNEARDRRRELNANARVL
jgi:hypothetical protein